MRTPVLDALRPFVWLMARLFWRVRFEGVRHIPPAGPLIIAPNHVTYADPVLIWIPVRLRVHFMAWDALFDIPGLAWLIRRLRAFPVQLGAADTRSTREAVRILQSVPVTILGGHESWPPGRVLPRPGRLTIVYHTVVTPPAGGDARTASRTLSRLVREAIARPLPAGRRQPDADA